MLLPMEERRVNAPASPLWFRSSEDVCSACDSDPAPSAAPLATRDAGCSRTCRDQYQYACMRVSTHICGAPARMLKRMKWRHSQRAQTEFEPTHVLAYHYSACSQPSTRCRWHRHFEAASRRHYPRSGLLAMVLAISLSPAPPDLYAEECLSQRQKGRACAQAGK